jgi:hypothetical protein
MENTMNEKTVWSEQDMAHLIFVIKQWAREPENSWFDLKFVNSMERILQTRLDEYDRYDEFWGKSPLTVKQKKALLNIHTKCLKQEYKGACDHCRGSVGWMYLCEREYMVCLGCNSKYDEDYMADRQSKVVKEGELTLDKVCPELWIETADGKASLKKVKTK